MRIKDILNETQQLDENIIRIIRNALKRFKQNKGLDAKTTRAVNKASKSLIKDLENRAKELNFRYQNQQYADRHVLIKDLKKIISDYKPRVDELSALQRQFYKKAGVPDLEIDSLIKAYKELNLALKTGKPDQKYLKKLFKQLDEYPHINDLGFVFRNMYDQAMLDAKYGPLLSSQIILFAITLLVFINASIAFLIKHGYLPGAISKVKDERPEDTGAQD